MFAGSYYMYLVDSYKAVHDKTPLEYIKSISKGRYEDLKYLDDIINFLVDSYLLDDGFNDDVCLKILDEMYGHSIKNNPLNDEIDERYLRSLEGTIDYYDSYIKFIDSIFWTFNDLISQVRRFEMILRS